MQHDAAGSLKLHRLFEDRRSLKVTEPCPQPSAKQPPPRIQIQDVRPQVDCGRYPVKATEGDSVDVSATIFKDGHDILRAVVRYRAAGSRKWLETPLEPLGNDRWAGSFRPAGLGRWQFTIEAWVDRYATLLDELDRKLAAGQTELAGELSEAEALFGPGEPGRVARRRGEAGREGPAREDVARQAARGRRRAAPRAVRRLVRALPPQLGRLQGRQEGAAASWPSSASTSSTCRRSTRSARRTARAATTR